MHLGTSVAANIYEVSSISQTYTHVEFFCSLSSDCETYEIYQFSGYEGKCPVITTESGATSPEYCLEACLGKVSCRGGYQLFFCQLFRMKEKKNYSK